MRPSLRFLALAVVGWAGLRAATLGALPGAEIFRIDRSEAKPPPPIVPTQFPAIEPVEPATPVVTAANSAPAPIQYVQGVIGVPIAIRPGVVPVYHLPPAAPAPSVAPSIQPAHLTDILPEPALNFYSPFPPLGQEPMSRMAAASMPIGSGAAVPGQSIPATFRRNPIDKVQLTAWALLRGTQGVTLGAPSLASGGTLGGSQAGARISYTVTRQVAATLRTSSDVGRRGGEVAAGVRIQPVGGIPVWLTAERRQRLGRYGGGRNAFALFFEGGVYDKPMPWQFNLDAYLQGGAVGFHSRDGFIDGGLTFTRPVYRQFSAGLGVWGGAQPGLYRVDAGPRVTMRVRKNIRVHLDWRQRLAGNAQPGSGPAITLAGDF
jgi:hypothetical protein